MKDISKVAMEKAVLLGDKQPVRVPMLFACTECGASLKSAHIVPEGNASEGVVGFVVPCLCMKCVKEKKDAGESTSEA